MLNQGMDYGRLTIDGRLGKFREIATRNDLVPEVLARAAELDLPSWYLTAGWLCQNVVTGRPPAEGIKDYDLFYFDDSDLSWEAENSVIEEGTRRFGDLPATLPRAMAEADRPAVAQLTRALSRATKRR